MFQKWVPNIFKRSALSRDLSRALGPRDPPRPPLSTSAQPPGQTFPFPFWSRRRNPRPTRWKEGGARSSRGAPHPPIHRDSPHLTSIHPAPIAASRRHAREGSHGRSRTLATCVLAPSPICNSFLAGLQLFFVLFPSHLLDLIPPNLRKSSL